MPISTSASLRVTAQIGFKTVMPHEQEAMRRWHMSTSVIIKIHGDKAAGECYGIAVGTAADDEGTLS